MISLSVTFLGAGAVIVYVAIFFKKVIKNVLGENLEKLVFQCKMDFSQHNFTNFAKLKKN
jgi:hypothetical protein